MCFIFEARPFFFSQLFSDSLVLFDNNSSPLSPYFSCWRWISPNGSSSRSISSEGTSYGLSLMPSAAGKGLLCRSQVCMPLNLGGLDIPDLAAQGKALKLKVLWPWQNAMDADKPWHGLPLPSQRPVCCQNFHHRNWPFFVVLERSRVKWPRPIYYCLHKALQA